MRKQKRYYNQGSKQLQELQLRDVVHIRPDPNSTQKTWRKRVCHETLVTRLYELISHGKVYRRNKKQKPCSIKRKNRGRSNIAT